jgi:hypothetical protein
VRVCVLENLSFHACNACDFFVRVRVRLCVCVCVCLSVCLRVCMSASIAADGAVYRRARGAPQRRRRAAGLCQLCPHRGERFVCVFLVCQFGRIWIRS